MKNHLKKEYLLLQRFNISLSAKRLYLLPPVKRMCLLLSAMLMSGAINICMAQDKTTVSGKVVTEKGGEGLEFATVALSGPDSLTVAGTLTDENGAFSLNALPGTYTMSVSILGYVTYSRVTNLDKGSVDMGTISMEEDTQALEAAVVQAQLPRTEMKGDAIVTNVTGSVLEHTGNAQELLSKIPGIITRDGNLEVIGRGAPQFYINGRKVLNLDELRNLMSEDIRSVEVISNPGAIYGGDIHSVVRIRTIRRQGDGFGFALTSQAQKYLRNNDFDPSWSVLDLNYRTGNVDFIGKILYWDHHSYQYSNNEAQSFLQDQSFAQKGTISYWQHANALNGRFGINWQISENHSVGFLVEHEGQLKGKYNKIFDEDVLHNMEFVDHILTDAEGKNIIGSLWNGNLYYNGKVDELEIDFNTDFQTNTSENAEKSTENSIVDPKTIETNTSSRTNVLASKLVFSYPLWKGKIQAGVEESFVKASQTYNINITDIPSADASLTENTIAAFAEYAFAFSHSQLQAGIRYEHVDYFYNDKIGTGSLERHQNNWFPSIAFSTQLGPVALSASFSGKTRRPQFWKLTNEIQYHSRYAYQTGDPTLKNETYLNGGLNAKWKWLVLSGTYEKITNSTIQWAQPYDDKGTVLLKYRNLDIPVHKFSAYLSATPTIGCWNPRYTLGLSKQFLSLTMLDPREVSGYRTASFNKPMYLVQLDNTFRFKHSWQCSIDYQFRSAMDQNNINVLTSINLLGASVQKSFLKDDALTFKLSVSDILNKNIDNALCDFGSILMMQDDDRMSPSIILRVSYRFNASTSKYKGTGAGQSVKERL